MEPENKGSKDPPSNAGFGGSIPGWIKISHAVRNRACLPPLLSPGAPEPTGHSWSPHATKILCATPKTQQSQKKKERERERKKYLYKKNPERDSPGHFLPNASASSSPSYKLNPGELSSISRTPSLYPQNWVVITTIHWVCTSVELPQSYPGHPLASSDSPGQCILWVPHEMEGDESERLDLEHDG